MSVAEQTTVDVSPELVDAIAQFPTTRTVKHCGQSFSVSPFDLYAVCPQCSSRVKVRGFAAVPELEDVFDAVFAWMNQPGAAEVAEKRRREMAREEE
jgi:hypothetical protein